MQATKIFLQQNFQIYSISCKSMLVLHFCSICFTDKMGVFSAYTEHTAGRGNTVDRARRNLPTVQRLQLVFYKKILNVWHPYIKFAWCNATRHKKGSAVISKVPQGKNISTWVYTATVKTITKTQIGCKVKRLRNIVKMVFK